MVIICRKCCCFRRVNIGISNTTYNIYGPTVDFMKNDPLGKFSESRRDVLDKAEVDDNFNSTMK